MKPAPFEYYAPSTVDEVSSHLEDYGDEAKLLAGGQSLVPTMNFRLAQPSVIIDLNRVEDLFFLRTSESDELRIGAMTRQRKVERSSEVEKKAPLLHEALPYIAHPQIRNRGTVGGSIAHADPASELPAIMLALDARFKVASRREARWIPATEFFTGLFSCAMEPDELLVEIAVPPLAPASGGAFHEIARRHGDYALVGVAAQVSLDENDRCRKAHLTFLSVGDGPVEATRATQLLTGEAPTAELIRQAAEIAATDEIDPPNDIHASAAYRRHLARVLAGQTLTRAFQRAKDSRRDNGTQRQS